MAEDEKAQAENAEAEDERDTKIQALEAQLASAVTEAKGHQKRAEKNKAESTRLESLESRIETLTSMTAEVLDKETDYSEDKRRKSDVYLDRLKGEDEQRRLREKVRQKMQEKGLLDTDTGGPQGAGGKAFTTKEIDKMGIKEYREKFPGGYGDVLKAIQEGRIKE